MHAASLMHPPLGVKKGIPSIIPRRGCRVKHKMQQNHHIASIYSTNMGSKWPSLSIKADHLLAHLLALLHPAMAWAAQSLKLPIPK